MLFDLQMLCLEIRYLLSVNHLQLPSVDKCL